MSFFSKLMEDAKPKAEMIQRVTKKVGSGVGNNAVVRVAKKASYAALVNTVGIGCVLAQPVVNKARELGETVSLKLAEYSSESTPVRK